MGHHVGIDLHRRRSVIVVVDDDGNEVWTREIDNDPATSAAAIVDVGPDPEVVIEATWGWYWAADVIADRMVERLVKRAGIDKCISPPSLRHSFITAALDGGVPRRDVREAAGHADPSEKWRPRRADAPMRRTSGRREGDGS